MPTGTRTATPTAANLSVLRMKLRALFMLHGWTDGTVFRDGCTRYECRDHDLVAKINRKGQVEFKRNGVEAQVYQCPAQNVNVEHYILAKQPLEDTINLNQLTLLEVGRQRFSLVPNAQGFIFIAESLRLGGRREVVVPMSREQVTSLRDQLTSALQLVPVTTVAPTPSPQFQVGMQVRTCNIDSDQRHPALSSRRLFEYTGHIVAIISREATRGLRQPEYQVEFGGGTRHVYLAQELTPTCQDGPVPLRRLQVGMQVASCPEGLRHPAMARRRCYSPHVGVIVALVGESGTVRGEPEYEVEFEGGNTYHYLEQELTPQ